MAPLTVPVTLDPTGAATSPVATAALSTGMGTWTLAFGSGATAAQGIQLTVPATTKKLQLNNIKQRLLGFWMIHHFKRKQTRYCMKQLHAIPYKMSKGVHTMNQQLLNGSMLLASSFFIFIGSYSVEASEMTFSVKAILPDNQRTKETSYFDLRVAPNQTQKLQIELTNQTANDITVLASANAAITNDNGLADYSHAETKRSVCTFYF